MWENIKEIEEGGQIKRWKVKNGGSRRKQRRKDGRKTRCANVFQETKELKREREAGRKSE